MYFLLLMLKSRRKRSALQPQTVYSEFPMDLEAIMSAVQALEKATAQGIFNACAQG